MQICTRGILYVVFDNTRCGAIFILLKMCLVGPKQERWRGQVLMAECLGGCRHSMCIP